MIQINQQLSIPMTEIEFSAIRAQGAGGQNVNKVSSAMHLRFDIAASSLPEQYKQALLTLNDRRISKDGIIVIKAQQYRTQEKNRTCALARLQELIHQVTIIKKVRRPTRPSKNSKKRRVDNKTQRGKTKILRQKILDI